MNLKSQWVCCGNPTKVNNESLSGGISQPAVTNNNDGGWCQAIVQTNWREVGILTMAFSCICLGIFVVIQGFHWLSQMWVIGPILIMSGIAIIIAAFVIRQKPGDNEMLSDKYISNNRQQFDSDMEECDRREQQAVPMEPLVFLLH